jgi:putative phosphoesterase
MTRSPDHSILEIGVISDTHGLLRPEALAGLAGSRAIIHAGDVGDPAILNELERIAPVTSVRGNIDIAPWAKVLPQTNVLETGGVSLYVLHNINELDLDPAAAGFTAVIYGHSHKPSMEQRRKVLFFNPGSAGPKRFGLPVSIGKLIVRDGKLMPELIELKVG